MNLREALAIRRKLVVLEFARGIGSTVKACREFEVPRSTFYRWKQQHDVGGAEGLERRGRVAYRHPRRLPAETVEKILELRRTYSLGPQRITWYLVRYHGIKTSCATVYRTLVRQGLRWLPRGTPRRAIHTRRYSKEVPGHHVQVDVKFVTLAGADGKRICRFQYTAIDDATRIRALQIYERHSCIKPRTPQLLRGRKPPPPRLRHHLGLRAHAGRLHDRGHLRFQTRPLH